MTKEDAMTKAKVRAEAAVIPVEESERRVRAAERAATEWTWTKAWAIAKADSAKAAWEAARAAAKESAETWADFKAGALERAARARFSGNSYEAKVWTGAAKDAAARAAKAEAVFAAGNPFS